MSTSLVTYWDERMRFPGLLQSGSNWEKPKSLRQ